MFDALTAARAYHQTRNVSEALRILKDSAGYELDPDVVAATVTWFENIARHCHKALTKLVLGDLLQWPCAPEKVRSCTNLSSDREQKVPVEPQRHPVMVSIGHGDPDLDSGSPGRSS